MTKFRAVALIVIILGAFSVFAEGECQVCDQVEFIYGGTSSDIYHFCRDARDNEYGSTRCNLTSWTTRNGHVVVQCQHSGDFCSVMVVEVNQ
jgi:hypothetical protein